MGCVSDCIIKFCERDILYIFSFLRSLIPQFNELTQKELIQSLLSKADGRTVVNMKAHFTNIALLSISRVRI